jgi:hypothetical protein
MQSEAQYYTQQRQQQQQNMSQATENSPQSKIFQIGDASIVVYSISTGTEVLEILCDRGVRNEEAEACAADLDGPTPRILGTAFHQRDLVLVKRVPDAYVMSRVIAHEIGHILCAHSGFPQTEHMADNLASHVTAYHGNMITQWVRNTLGLRSCPGVVEIKPPS